MESKYFTLQRGVVASVKPDEERFDIYDDKMNPAGTAARQVVHAQGLWHRTFQCWIISDQDECPTLLFQKRHPDKDTYPGLLDISCAGHLQAGEGIEDGVRELKEELGIEVSFEELEPRGIYYAQKQPAPDLIDREICHVFIYRSDQALASYRLQTAEVTGLYRVKLEDVKRLIRGFQEDETIEAEGVELDKQGDLQYVVRCYGKNDFVPHTPEYYELIINF
jgi:isopentenyldiphosphate isomerase